MQLNTVIFDIDGLLIDSKPLWHEAATDTFKSYGDQLTNAMYASTTGLRTKEFVDWWFQYFKIDMQHAPDAEKEIVKGVLKKIEEKASIMPGVPHIFDFFANKEFKIGLATSSPQQLIQTKFQL